MSWPEFKSAAPIQRTATESASGRREQSQAAIVERRAFADWGDTERAIPVEPPASFNCDGDIMRIAAGDKGCFAELFHHWAPRAKAYLTDRGLPPAIAEDLATQALVEVWLTARLFEPLEQSIPSWIFQRLRNVIRHSGAVLSG